MNRAFAKYTIWISILVFLEALIPYFGYSKCRNLGELLDQDNPRVKSYLQRIPENQIGKRVQGITLCNGQKFLDGLTFKGRILGLPEWNIYLFQIPNENREIAIAWVEPGGRDIEVPKPAQNPIYGEDAYIISYDVFSYTKVRAGKDVVIINYPHSGWKAWIASFWHSEK